MYISQSQQKSGPKFVREICRYTGTPFHLPRRLITYQCTLGTPTAIISSSSLGERKMNN